MTPRRGTRCGDLLQVVSDVSGIPTERTWAGQTLSELGIDSFLLFELQQQLAMSYSVRFRTV